MDRCVVSQRSVEDRQAASQKKLKGLSNHHSQCEINYHRCIVLVPDCRNGVSKWVFSLGEDAKNNVLITLLESAPYTTTIDLSQNFAPLVDQSGDDLSGYLSPARLKIRLYHDVEMAEVIAWDRHRHWQPVYEYPNRLMYQPDEKMVLNRFLGELLYHCRKLGIAHDDVCDSIHINRH